MLRVLRMVLVFSLGVLVATLSFAAGAQEDDDGMEEEQIVLRYPHWFFGHGGNFEEWINGAVDAFEAEYPNIQVEREHVPYDQYWEQLDIAIASGNAPDVAAFGGNLAKYVAAGALTPLNDLIDMEDVERNFSALQTELIPAADSEEGRTFALAFDSGFYLPLYRPSLFEEEGIREFPTTPDAFVDMARELTAGDRYGYAFMNNPGNYNEQRIDLIIWTVGLGGHYVDRSTGEPALDSPEVIQAVTYLKELHDAGAVPRDTDKGTYRKMFATKNVAVIIDGMWMHGLAIGWDETAAGDFETADTPFPTRRVPGFAEVNAILADSEHKEEAALLIQYLANEEQQRRLVEITQLIPPRTSVFTDELKADLIERWPWYERFIAYADDAVPMDPNEMPGELKVEVHRIWGKYFDRVLFEDMDPAEAMRLAQEEATNLY